MPGPRIPIDDLPEQTSLTDTDDTVVQVGDVTMRMRIARITSAITNAIAAHVATPTGAHEAVAISAADSGSGVNGLNVQAQLVQLSSRLSVEESEEGIEVGPIPPDDPEWLWADTTDDGSGAAIPGPTYTDVRNYGGAGDGVTDNYVPILDALVDAAGGVLAFGEGTYLIDIPGTAPGVFNLPANTTLRGQGKQHTTLVIVSDNTTDFRNVFQFSADGCCIEGMTIRRASDFPSVMFPVSPGVDGATLRDCIFDGGDDLYTASYTHGLSLPNSGAVSGVRVEGCTFTNFVYPLLQTNASTATITDIRFVGCDIRNWAGAGLSFNSPVGVNRGVLIDGCRFYSTTGGLAVGFAHTESAICTNSHFEVSGEAIHIEDYSNNCIVTNNTFYRCTETATLSSQSVIEVFDSSNLLIDSNTFDNPNLLATPGHWVICVHGDQVGTTVGGRPRLDATHSVRISRNIINAGPNTAINIVHTARLAIEDNTIRGGLSINSSLVESGTNDYWGIKTLVSSSLVLTIARNTIVGFRHGIGPPAFNTGSYQHGTSIAGNTISECRFGLIGNNTRAAAYTGNVVFRCIHPMIVRVTGAGGAGVGHDSYSLTGNVFYGNKLRASINGVQVVVATGTASIGSGVTLTVEPLVGDVHNTKAITFAGGGVLTTTSAFPSGSTSITGNVTIANIASGEAGFIAGAGNPDRPYEAPFTENVRGVAANTDSVAKTYT